MKKSPLVIFSFAYAASVSKPAIDELEAYFTAFTVALESFFSNSVTKVVALLVSVAFAAVIVTAPAVSEPNVALGVPRLVTASPFTVEDVSNVASLEI